MGYSMAKTKRPPRENEGRPKIKFTEVKWKEFEQLCSFQCTKIEIQEWFGITDKTLDRLLKGKYKKSFSDVFSQKRSKGKVSLRRKQWLLADTNAAVAIFLGKNYLGQADKQEIEHSGSIEQKVDNMSKKERLARIKELKKKL